MNKITSLLLVMLLVFSCTMIPEYKKPQSPVAEKFPGCDKKEQEKTVAQIKWQEFFKSPDLQKIIQTALDNNRDLRVAALNIDAAKALYRVSLSSLAPSVEVGAGSTKEFIPQNALLPGQAATSTYYNANVSAAFEIDLFGKIRSQNKSALETFLATAEAKKATQISLIAEVANAYLQFLADQKILQLSVATVAVQEQSFKLMQKKFDYGVISKLDLLQARTAIETVKANQALYAKQTEQDKNALLLLMGVPHSDLLDKFADLDNVKLMTNLPIGLKSDVLLSRPDIMQAEHQLKSANASIGAARAAFFPSISLTGSYGYESSDLSHLFSAGSGGAWSFAPQINVPIFQGGQNIANLDYAKIRKNIAIATYEKSIQSAFREVADQLSARKHLDEQMQAENNLVMAAQGSYDIAGFRYSEGIDSFLSTLDAERTLFSAKQNQISLEKEKLSNLVNLYKVLGGGEL